MPPPRRALGRLAPLALALLLLLTAPAKGPSGAGFGFVVVVNGQAAAAPPPPACGPDNPALCTDKCTLDGRAMDTELSFVGCLVTQLQGVSCGLQCNSTLHSPRCNAWRGVQLKTPRCNVWDDGWGGLVRAALPAPTRRAPPAQRLARRATEPGRYCSKYPPTRCEPSFLELNGIL